MNENIELNEVIFEEIHANEFNVIESNISYNNFFKHYLSKNQACLIKNVSNSWKASKLWVTGELPNFSYLRQHFGEAQVPVQNCKDAFSSTTCSKWKFKDYLQYWEDSVKCGYPKDMPLFYLKDWHLNNDFPSDDCYKVPIYFASDWLNEYLVENSLDDYRFVYMGIKGTWSPLHVDVMTSYSWSSNICGQKRWLLFPPGEESRLKNPFGKLPHDVTNMNKNCKYFEVIQEPGDVIFVPSNWHHQVWNLGDTISINRNWINGCNLKSVWHAMDKSLLEVMEEIQDCADMENLLEHCQLMLQALFGMDFIKFYEFLSYIACKRINLLQDGIQICLPENRQLGRNHALFDLSSIKNTLVMYIKHDVVSKLSRYQHFKVLPTTLLNNIESVISTYNM